MTLKKVTLKIASKLTLFTSAILFSCSFAVLAENDESGFSIPTIANAQVFADFSDDIPAVLNYFTRATEEQIIDFYQQSFGESISQERKRGRLTLTYQQETKNIRVVISQQNKKRQVDVIVETLEE